MKRRGLKLRLRTTMFLQFFLNGTTLPIFSLELKGLLDFTGTEVGVITGISSASWFVSPARSEPHEHRAGGGDNGGAAFLQGLEAAGGSWSVNEVGVFAGGA